MALTKRLVKGSPLTFQEGDNNLQYLEDFIEQISGSYATTGSNTFQGTQTVFGDLIVYGTSSISYTTQSATNIGTNTITVNTNTPAVRFGGLIVFDSGSTNLSGSLFWDSINQHWIYQKPDGSSYESGMLISGPKNSLGLGNERGTLLNVITKGQGEDHITSSALIEDGTNLRVAVNAIITGSLTVSGSSISVAGNVTNNLTASYAVSASQAISAFQAFSSSYALSASYVSNADLLDGLNSTQFVLTSSFNTYTSSISTTISSINAATSSLNRATASLYNFSSSILNYTASNDITISSLFGVTGSLNDFSASILNYTSSNDANITSLQSYTQSLNLTTGSLQRATASLYNATSSLYNFSASMNSFTASQRVLNGTFATTGSNTFVGSQTVQGNVTVTGNLIAQQYIVSSSQIYVTESFSSGSNVFGNSMDDYHQFTGSVYITGSLQVVAGSTNDHFISGGNVGIGISNPQFQLQTSKAAQNYIAIDNTNDNSRLLLGAEQSSNTILSQNLSTLAPVDLKFAVATTSSLYISSSANIGIGTNFPTAKLHISGTTGTLLNVTINNTSSLFISSSGNIGMGTTASSAAALHIFSSTPTVIIQNNSGSIGNTTTIAFRNLLSSGATHFTGFIQGIQQSVISNTGDLGFATYANGSVVDVMRLTNSGSVGINETNPKATLDIAVVNPNVSGSLRMQKGIIYFQTTQQGVDGLVGRLAADYLVGETKDLASNGAYIDFRRTNLDYGNNIDIVFGTNPGGEAFPTERMRISRTGQISMPGTVTFGAGSPTAVLGSDGTIITPKVRLYNGNAASQYHHLVSAASQNWDILIPNQAGTMALILNNNMTVDGTINLVNNNNGYVYSFTATPGIIFPGGTYDFQANQANSMFGGIYEVSLTATYNVAGSRKQASVLGYLYWADDGPSNDGGVSTAYTSGFALSYPTTRTVRFTNNTGYQTYADTRVVIRLVNRGLVI
jgi:hypothetical protein